MLCATSIALGSVPSGCMLLFTFLGLGRKVPSTVAGALQHFAAGILLCTIGTELLPTMATASGWKENLASAFGFFLGVALLIALGIILPETEGVGEDDGGKSKDIENAVDLDVTGSTEKEDRGKPVPFHLRRSSLKSAAFRTLEVQHCEKDVVKASPLRLGEEIALLSPSEAMPSAPVKPFPTALVLAIAIDSALDGLLIGIAIAAGPTAGPMLSASLSVEMSFLGLTLATALHGHPAHRSLPAAFLGPSMILLGATIGELLSSTLGTNPALLVGMLSFGTSALLFMVAEELLLEAHEDGGEHLWWVDLQLYTGFFASVTAGKLLPDD